MFSVAGYDSVCGTYPIKRKCSAVSIGVEYPVYSLPILEILFPEVFFTKIVLCHYQLSDDIPADLSDGSGRLVLQILKKILALNPNFLSKTIVTRNFNHGTSLKTLLNRYFPKSL